MMGCNQSPTQGLKEHPMPTFTLPFLTMLLMPGFMAYRRAVVLVVFLRVAPMSTPAHLVGPLGLREGSLMREVSHVSAAASFPPCHPRGPSGADRLPARSARGPPCA